MRSTQISVVWLLMLGGLLGCPFPKDPENTYEQIAGGVLRVGLTENPPWVIRKDDGSPAGVEVDLLKGFAEHADAEVAWYWDGPEDNFDALSRYVLHVVAGGYTQKNPWKKHVGFTTPFHTERIVVGVPPGDALLTDISRRRVAVAEGSALVRTLLEHRAVAVEVDDPFGTGLPVAAGEWEIRTHNYVETEVTFGKHEHVMAVPNGENRLLTELSRYLLENKQVIRQQETNE